MSSVTAITCAKSTYLSGNATATNYGSSATLLIGQHTASPNTRSHAIFSFDCSGLTDPSAIVKAELKLSAVTCTGSAVRNIYAYRLDTDFNETQATWQVSAALTNWTGGNSVGAANNTAITQYSKSASRKLEATEAIGFRVNTDPLLIDVTELVKDAINRRSGTLLLWVGIPLSDTSTSTGQAVVGSNNHASSGSRPLLNVTIAARIAWDGSAGDGDTGTASNYVGNSLPDSYDFVFFNDGAIDVTTGTAISCNSVFVGEGYTGECIKSNGDPIDFLTVSTTDHPVQNRFCINKKTGKFSFRITLSSVQVDVYIKNTPLDECKITAYTADDTKVHVLGTRGVLELIADTAPVLSGVSQVKLSGTATSVIAGGSRLTLENGCVSGTFFDRTRVTCNDGALTYYIVISGKSKMQMKGTGITGALYDVNIYSGSLYFKDNDNGVITCTTVPIYIWEDGMLDTRTGTTSANFGSQIKVRGRGDFMVDAGRTVAIS